MKNTLTRTFSLSPDCLQKLKELRELINRTNGMDASASKVAEFAICELHRVLTSKPSQ